MLILATLRYVKNGQKTLDVIYGRSPKKFLSPLIDLGDSRGVHPPPAIQITVAGVCNMYVLSDGIIGSWDEIVLKSAIRLLQKFLLVNPLWVLDIRPRRRL